MLWHLTVKPSEFWGYWQLAGKFKGRKKIKIIFARFEPAIFWWTKVKCSEVLLFPIKIRVSSWSNDVGRRTFKIAEKLPSIVDIMKVDALLVQKYPKRQLFRDIGNSIYEVTYIGLEPHWVFFLFEISQQIWSLEASKALAKIGCGVQAVWNTTKNFCQVCTDMWWSNAENFKKMSRFLFEL